MMQKCTHYLLCFLLTCYEINLKTLIHRLRFDKPASSRIEHHTQQNASPVLLNILFKCIACRQWELFIVQMWKVQIQRVVGELRSHILV